MQPYADPQLPPFLQALVLELYARRSEGIIVPGKEVSTGDWKPEPNSCHDNVAAWIAANPGTRQIYGYLHFGVMALFNPHSVVEAPDGSLYDITPSRAPQRYPFIRHVGSEELFAEASVRIQLKYGFRA